MNNKRFGRSLPETNWKSTLASTIRHLVTRVPTGVRGVTLCALLVFASFPALAIAETPCPGIHVKVLNIRNNNGAVCCALFQAPKGFPDEFLRYATNIMIIKVQDTKAHFDFVDIPPGRYALVVIHDENMDGKLRKNWLGVPKEGFGFSKDAKASMSAPSFEAASFTYDGKNLVMTIELQY